MKVLTASGSEGHPGFNVILQWVSCSRTCIRIGGDKCTGALSGITETEFRATGEIDALHQGGHDDWGGHLHSCDLTTFDDTPFCIAIRHV